MKETVLIKKCATNGCLNHPEFHPQKGCQQNLLEKLRDKNSKTYFSNNFNAPALCEPKKIKSIKSLRVINIKCPL